MIKKAKRLKQAMMENKAEPQTSPAWSRSPKLIKEAELMDAIKKELDVTDKSKLVKKAEMQKAEKQELDKSSLPDEWGNCRVDYN